MAYKVQTGATKPPVLFGLGVLLFVILPQLTGLLGASLLAASAVLGLRLWIARRELAGEWKGRLRRVLGTAVRISAYCIAGAFYGALLVGAALAVLASAWMVLAYPRA